NSGKPPDPSFHLRHEPRRPVATVQICDLVQYRRAGKDSRFALFADEKPKNWQEPQRVPTDILLPIGVFVLLYAAYALVQGEVWAKDRWAGKRVTATRHRSISGSWSPCTRRWVCCSSPGVEHRCGTTRALLP